MTNRCKNTVLTVSIFLFTASMLHAEDSGRKPDRNRWNQGGQGQQGHMLLERLLNNQRMIEKLGLTEEQVSALRNGMFDLKKEKIQKHADLQIAATEQARILTEFDIDESALMAAVEKTGQLRTDIAKLQMKGLLLIHKILTKQQRSKIGPMLKQRHRQRQHQDRNISGRDQRSRGQNRDPEQRRQRGDAGDGPVRGE